MPVTFIIYWIFLSGVLKRLPNIHRGIEVDGNI